MMPSGTFDKVQQVSDIRQLQARSIFTNVLPFPTTGRHDIPVTKLPPLEALSNYTKMSPDNASTTKLTSGNFQVEMNGGPSTFNVVSILERFGRFVSNLIGKDNVAFVVALHTAEHPKDSSSSWRGVVRAEIREDKTIWREHPRSYVSLSSLLGDMEDISAVQSDLDFAIELDICSAVHATSGHPSLSPEKVS
jgi:hypothetical protein